MLWATVLNSHQPTHCAPSDLLVIGSPFLTQRKREERNAEITSESDIGHSWSHGKGAAVIVPVPTVISYPYRNPKDKVVTEHILQELERRAVAVCQL